MATVTGTPGNDFIHVAGDGLSAPAGYTDNPGATSGDDTIYSGNNGNDIIHAGGGSDRIHFTSDYNANDFVDGGSGYNYLYVDNSASLTLSHANLQNVQDVILGTSAFYNFTTTDDLLASGQTIVFDGLNLTGSNSNLTLDASASTQGTIYAYGGTAEDDFYGGSNVSKFYGGAGPNDFFFEHGFSSSNHVEGGTGYDRMFVAHLANSSVTFGAGQLVSINDISFEDGSNYFVVMNDGNVASGATIDIEGPSNAADIFSFDATAETDGNYNVAAGAGNDIIGTGKGNDTVDGGAGSDTLYMDMGGNDTAKGGDGNDKIYFGATLTAADSIDGGNDNDTVYLNGDYSAGVLFGTATMVNVETLSLTAGHSYKLTTNDATVAAGKTLFVAGATLGAGDSLTLDGSAETNGAFNIAGGLGADTFMFTATNLTSADTVNGGTGTSIDQLRFTTAGTVAASAFGNVSHIERIVLVNGTNNIALTDAMVGSADDNHVLYAVGGSGNDTVNASAVTTVANRVFFTAGSGNDTLTGGFGGDTFYFAATDLTGADLVNGLGGTPADRIVFTTAGTIAAAAFQHVTHVEQLLLANGTNNVTVSDALAAASDNSHILTIVGGTGADAVNAGALSVANSAYITAGAGNDVLTGGLGLDIFYFGSADLTSGDTVNGGTGVSADILAFTTAGTVAAAAFQNVSHIEQLVLANGTNSITVTDALVSSADDGHVLYVSGGTGNDTVDASAVTTATNHIYFIGGTGNDALTGGLGGDDFFFAATDLTSGDTVNGGTGTSTDAIVFSSAGTIAASGFAGVSHIEQINLFNGVNNLALSDALVGSADDGHVLHVSGGTGADTISAAAVTTSTNRVVFIGGGGADALTGGAGADFFSYLTAGDSTGTGYDTITALNFTNDLIDIPGGAGTITAVESARGGALDSGVNFDTELASDFSTLAAHHAGLLTATSGILSGQTFLVVDLNGTTGYQSGADLVIHLVSPTGTLTAGDFT